MILLPSLSNNMEAYSQVHISEWTDSISSLVSYINNT